MQLQSPVARPLSFAVTPTPSELLIDAAGGGDATVIQTGLDTKGDNFTAFIKAGTYAAGFTEASSGVRIFVEPGTIIQAAITMSGDNCTLIIGAGADIQGRITMSGSNCSLLCKNGVDIDGVVLSGDKCLVDGGGLDTLVNGGTANDAIQIIGTDCIVKNIAAQTTAGGGNAFAGISVEADRATIKTCKVVDSDTAAIDCLSGVTDLLIEGCVILGADTVGITLRGFRNRVIGNYLINTGTNGMDTGSLADDTVITGNIVQDHGGDAINIAVNTENCVVVGNRTDGAVVDNSGTSTVADNDETAF